MQAHPWVGVRLRILMAIVLREGWADVFTMLVFAAWHIVGLLELWCTGRTVGSTPNALSFARQYT